MRAKSIKTLVVAVSVAATLTFSVPAAEAAPTRTRETVSQREEPRGAAGRVARAIQRLVTRLTGGVTTNNWPDPPKP
jgi:hypothetical protein